MALISRLCAAAVGLLFLASSTQASVIVVSYSNFYSAQDVSGGLDIPLSFQQFDPSLGTLQSVGLEDAFTLSATTLQMYFWLFDNCVPNTEAQNPNTATFTGITGVSKTVQATDPSDGSAYTDAVSCGNAVTTATSTSSFLVTSLLTGGATSGYIGLSQIGLNAHIDGGDYQGSVSGASTVTYTYDTGTPAPETSFMAEAGLAALACARWWRLRSLRTPGAL
jgi:hypothetical protein